MVENLKQAPDVLEAEKIARTRRRVQVWSFGVSMAAATAATAWIAPDNWTTPMPLVDEVVVFGVGIWLLVSITAFLLAAFGVDLLDLVGIGRRPE